MNNVFMGTADPRLYCAQTVDSSLGRTYYLLYDIPATTPPEITAVNVWNNPIYSGIYVFCPEPVNDATAFVHAVTDYLSKSIHKKKARLFWCPFPNEDIIRNSVTGRVDDAYGNPRTAGDIALNLFNVALVIQSGCHIIYDDKSGSIVFTNTDKHIVVKVSPSSDVLNTLGRRAALSLFSSAAGTVTSPLSLTRKWVWRFGCDLRYFSTSARSESKLLNYRFPVLNLAMPDQSGHPFLRLSLTLSPFDFRSEVSDWMSTLRFTGNNSSVLTYFRTVSGAPIRFSPIENNSGFRFALFPTTPDSTPDDDVYLTLDGLFTIVSEGEECDLLCGLSGMEKIRIRSGDLMSFKPCQPAFFETSKDFSNQSLHGKTSLLDSLDGRCTTAWPGGILEEKLNKSNGISTTSGLGYYTQSERSPFHYKPVPTKGKGPATLMVSDALFSELTTASPLPHVPMVPYAGIDAIGEQGEQSNNKDIKLAVFTDLENRILGPTRRSLMLRSVAGPRYHTPKDGVLAPHEIKSLSAKKDVSPEKKGLTPQGLPVIISNEPGVNYGRWVELILSKSNAASDGWPYLSFTSAVPEKSAPSRNPLDQLLQDMMQTDQLFLVISDSTHIGYFNSKVSLDGFTFDLKLGDRENDTPGSILIFKFHTGSVASLVADIATWSRPGDFNAHRETDIQEFLKKYITAAEQAQASHPGLSRFCDCIEDENWNGILALNTAIDATGIPKEIIGLMGGMDQPLRGHHLQITINQITSDGTFALDENSLCGLIQYPLINAPKETSGIQMNNDDTAIPFDFNVTNFEATFENGLLSGIDCSVDLTIEKLFGRRMVTENVASSVIALNGRFQTRDGQNIFLFNNQKNLIFVNPESAQSDPVRRRVVKKVTIFDATFNTVSTDAKEEPPGSQEIKARFSLTGSMAFNSDIQKMDLFGYGGERAETDLPFSDLYLDIETTLTHDGRRIGEKRMRFNPGNLTFDPLPDSAARSPLRNNSLPACLPFRLNGFKFDENGLTANKLSGKPVHIKFDTAGEREKNFDDLTTPAPYYALDFILPLGTLGALSSVHVAFDAHITVGWGPSPVVKDEDAVSMSVQLPELTPGFKGMSLQGVLKTTFGSASMLHMPFKKDGKLRRLYALAFNNVQLSLFGIGLPPGVMLDLFLFADVNSSTGGKSNLGWLLAYSGNENPKDKSKRKVMRDVASKRRIPTPGIRQAADELLQSRTVSSIMKKTGKR